MDSTRSGILCGISRTYLTRKCMENCSTHAIQRKLILVLRLPLKIRYVSCAVVSINLLCLFCKAYGGKFVIKAQQHNTKHNTTQQYPNADGGEASVVPMSWSYPWCCRQWYQVIERIVQRRWRPACGFDLSTG
jgi:hypothetical protein